MNSPPPAAAVPTPSRPQADDGLVARVSAIIANCADQRAAVPEVLRALAVRFDATAARIWSLSRSGFLRLHSSIGECPSCAALEDRIPADRSELGRVAVGTRPCVTDCLAESNPPEITSWAAQHRVTVFVSVPIRQAAQPCGVMGFFLRATPSAEELQLLIEAGRALAPLLTSDPDDDVDLSSSLIPCLSAAVIALDRHGAVTRWGGRAEEIFGWSASAVIGKPLPIIPPERLTEFMNLAEANGLKAYRGPAICQRANGSTIPIERVSGPLLNCSGQSVGRLEVLTDMSEHIVATRCLDIQTRVAQILARARNRGEAIPPLLLCIGDWLNCEVAEFWAADDAERLIREFTWASNPAVRERLDAAQRRIRRDGGAWQAQALRDGTVAYIPELDHDDVVELLPTHRRMNIPLAGLALPILCAGERLGVISVAGFTLCPPTLSMQTLNFVADASAQFMARARVEAELATTVANQRQSQKMDSLGLLTGGVAHDFNNVLTVILACSEMVLDDVEETDAIYEMISEVHSAGQRAATMTRQLLAVSRQQPPQMGLCRLNDVIDDMKRMLERLVGQAISLQHDGESTLAPVSADVGQIQQVLLNLVVNARDAMPDGGTITISANEVECPVTTTRRHGVPPGPYIRIRVRDTGCGMDEETLRRVFEPFFTTKAAGRGTGMGMATVAEIIQQHRGFLEVDSEVNAGTTVSFYLPPSRQKLATQTFDQRPEPDSGGTEAILIVESDEAVRSLTRRLLELRGYSVWETADVQAARSILRTRRRVIDLVLADLRTIAHDAKTLTTAVREARSNPRLLIMSGIATTSDLETSLPSRRLHKPFTSADLARQVRLAIDDQLTESES